MTMNLIHNGHDAIDREAKMLGRLYEPIQHFVGNDYDPSIRDLASPIYLL